MSLQQNLMSAAVSGAFTVGAAMVIDAVAPQDYRLPSDMEKDYTKLFLLGATGGLLEAYVRPMLNL